MKIRSVFYILFFIFIIYSPTLIKAEKENIKDILTTNIEKSTDEFYKNTRKDLQSYYQRQFDFYLNMGKNLISVKNINNVYTIIYNSFSNEIIKLQNSILKYINLIIPSDYK